MKRGLLPVLLIALLMVSGCRCGLLSPARHSTGQSTTSPQVAQQTPSTQGVVIVSSATKIAQLVGEYDKERQEPTLNLTWSRYKLAGTDLGVPFKHDGRTYLLFGDTIGIRGGDAIAYTTDTTPEDGLELKFLHDDKGYKPVKIPGISQGEMGLFSLDYFLFLLMVPLGAIVMTWVYNNTRRSILSAVLLHFFQNFSLDLLSGLHGALPTGYWALFAGTLGLLAVAIVAGWGGRTLTGRRRPARARGPSAA